MEERLKQEKLEKENYEKFRKGILKAKEIIRKNPDATVDVTAIQEAEA